jgi:hypothetical protein
MTVGKITSSQQDYVMVKVRPEDGTFFETDTGSTGEEQVQISASAGQEVTAPTWFGRIKMPASLVNASVGLKIWDSPAKVIEYFSLKLNSLNDNQILHIAFDPLPPGNYYFEILKNAGSLGITKKIGSTYPGAYLNGIEQTGYSWKLKIMLTPAEVSRPVAIAGDLVDDGITTIKIGSNLAAVQVGEVIGNIARVGDTLQNGGTIRSGAWFFQILD